MGNRLKDEISRTILNLFRPSNGIDVLKLPFLEEMYEKTFVVTYIDVAWQDPVDEIFLFTIINNIYLNHNSVSSKNTFRLFWTSFLESITFSYN